MVWYGMVWYGMVWLYTVTVASLKIQTSCLGARDLPIHSYKIKLSEFKRQYVKTSLLILETDLKPRMLKKTE